MQSTKPSKQRKMLYQAPSHMRYRFFAAPLSAALTASHGAKTLPVRTGDTVRVMRGDHKGFEGKISRVDRGNYRVYVEGLTREKVDGSTIFVPVHPSKVMITNLNLDDKWRRKILERKRAAAKKLEAPVKKPERKVVEVKEEVVAEQVAVTEKPKKPRLRRKRAVTKPALEKTEEAKEEAKEVEEAKPKKPRIRRKTAKKAEGEE